MKQNGRLLLQVQGQAGDQESQESDAQERKAGHTRDLPCLWDQSLPHRQGLIQLAAYQTTTAHSDCKCDVLAAIVSLMYTRFHLPSGGADQCPFRPCGSLPVLNLGNQDIVLEPAILGQNTIYCGTQPYAML